jgi:hypothetical protein
MTTAVMGTGAVTDRPAPGSQVILSGRSGTRANLGPDERTTMTDEPRNHDPLEPIAPVDPPTVDPPTVEAPTVEAPVTAGPADATPPAGEGPPPWSPPTDPASSPTPPRRSGVLVPIWALITVGGLLLLSIGFLSGWLIASERDDDREARITFDAGDLPRFGDRNGNPFGPGLGNGGNGSDDGSDDESDDGSGSTVTEGAYLGVAVGDSTDPPGASVMRVAPSSPAATANLETGDVITAVDGDPVRNAAQLTRRIRAHDPDDRVTVTYSRDGESATADVRLGSRPELERPAVPEPDPSDAF